MPLESFPRFFTQRSLNTIFDITLIFSIYNTTGLFGGGGVSLISPWIDLHPRLGDNTIFLISRRLREGKGGTVRGEEGESGIKQIVEWKLFEGGERGLLRPAVS